jgi:hypothetical protein
MSTPLLADQDRPCFTKITIHHAQLLIQASTTNHLSSALHQVRHGLDQVSLSLERSVMSITVINLGLS